MSEGCAADKFLKFPSAPSTARCPEQSAGTQTAGRLFFAYFLLAKQKNSRSPAAATERQRNFVKDPDCDPTQGFDRLSPNGVDSASRTKKERNRNRAFSGSEHKFPSTSSRPRGALQGNCDPTPKTMNRGRKQNFYKLNPILRYLRTNGCMKASRY